MFKEKFLAILTALGFIDKAKSKTLTADEWKKIEESFQEKYGISFSQALVEEQQSQEAQRLAQERTEALQILGSIEESSEEEGTDTSNDDIVKTSQKVVNRVQTLEKETAELHKTVNKMAGDAVPDIPQAVTQRVVSILGPGTTATHLFGIEHKFFSMDCRWNKIAHNPEYRILHEIDEEVDGHAYQAAVKSYAKSLASRYKYLKSEKLLDVKRLESGFTNDYTGLSNAGLGDQYLIRRQDALIARLLQVFDVYTLFPRRYGIQDRDLIINAFFGEFSQAYQTGPVWKGDMQLEPEMGHVDDAMFKTLFGPMKDIERMYIGYLNTDGSDPIKWSMIEWQLLNIYKKLIQEQNSRRIRGIYIKPEAGKPGSYLNSSTGVLYTLIRYIHEYKILPHADQSYRTYTSSTMLDAVKEFYSDVKQAIQDNELLNNYTIYLNQNHKDWWKECCRAKYGKDIDFAGPESYANVIPDTSMRILWVPYLGQDTLMFIQQPGNLQLLEYVPGEMLAVKITEDMEMVKCWSTWKEGCSAAFVGRNFTTLEKLKANNYKFQQIFVNKPAKTLAADATQADANTGFWFITPDNTAETTLTDIANAEPGIAYIIECEGTSNATKIAKTDRFSGITDAYTPTAPGDYLMVVLNSENQFIEMERCIGGIRTINKALQPNIPGAR